MNVTGATSLKNRYSAIGEGSKQNIRALMATGLTAKPRKTRTLLRVFRVFGEGFLAATSGWKPCIESDWFRMGKKC
jgi:hypothetical protein